MHFLRLIWQRRGTASRFKLQLDFRAAAALLALTFPLSTTICNTSQRLMITMSCRIVTVVVVTVVVLVVCFCQNLYN